MGWLADWKERREGRKALASEAHSATISPEQEAYLSTVDFNRETIPLDVSDDAASVMLQLVMQGHMVAMSQSGPDGAWVVQIDDDPREWVHEHQIIALTKALKDVQTNDKRGTT